MTKSVKSVKSSKNSKVEVIEKVEVAEVEVQAIEVVEVAEVEVQATEVVEESKESKTARGLKIYQEIMSPGYKMPSGKQARGHFMDRAKTELGLNAGGASTYFYAYKAGNGEKAVWYKPKNAGPRQKSLDLEI